MTVPRIVSRSEEAFLDRREAARLLLGELRGYRGRRPVVLGIPRGGVVIAAVLAEGLEGDLDVVLSRKLGAPGNPELAVGAVGEDGRVVADPGVLEGMGIPPEYLAREKERQMAEIARRASRYRAVRPKVPLAGRLVVVTDDGLATGATMRAALLAARAEGPSRLVMAVPVGPEETLRALAREADEALCLRVPPWFAAVGQFYSFFDQVEDAEVLELLGAAPPREARV